MFSVVCGNEVRGFVILVFGFVGGGGGGFLGQTISLV